MEIEMSNLIKKIESEKGLIESKGQLVNVNIAGARSKFEVLPYEGFIGGKHSFIGGHHLSETIINSWRIPSNKITYLEGGVLFNDNINRELVQYLPGSEEFKEAKKLLNKYKMWETYNKK